MLPLARNGRMLLRYYYKIRLRREFSTTKIHQNTEEFSLKQKAGWRYPESFREAGQRWHLRVVASFYLDFPHSDAYGIVYFFINGKSMMR
jgi:hypothetical protein